MTVLIRKPTLVDEENWTQLFIAYQAFYRERLSDEVIAKNWASFHDENSSLHAFVVEEADGGGDGENGRLIAFVHYLFHETTWAAGLTCYLEDLYVDKSARGSGIAQQLIEHVETAAREKNVEELYLHTQQYNSAARSLYDKVLSASSFIVYNKGLT